MLGQLKKGYYDTKKSHMGDHQAIDLYVTFRYSKILKKKGYDFTMIEQQVINNRVQQVSTFEGKDYHPFMMERTQISALAPIRTPFEKDGYYAAFGLKYIMQMRKSDATLVIPVP